MSEIVVLIGHTPNVQVSKQIDPSVNTNDDLLSLKNRKGLFFSEAHILHGVYDMANRINYRKFGNVDQREEHTKEHIAALKKEGNRNFANKTLVKFW